MSKPSLTAHPTKWPDSPMHLLPVPVLVTAALIATLCTFAALLTGMDTVFWVAGLIAVGCVAGCVAIVERAECVRRRQHEGGAS